MRFVIDTFGFILETVLCSEQVKGFQVLPKRWVVERTFGWFYKLQASGIFTTTTETPKLSKYKHLEKAGSQSHVEAVMGVVRRTIVSELQKTIDSLKESLLDVSFDSEQQDI